MRTMRLLSEADCVLSVAVVERVERYKYLGFVLHATKALTVWTTFLWQLPGRRCLPYRGDMHFCNYQYRVATGFTRSVDLGIRDHAV